MSLSSRMRVAALVEASPLTSETVLKDVHHLLSHGEEALALDTMCSWIYEYALPITGQYHTRLTALAFELQTPRSALLLNELVID